MAGLVVLNYNDADTVTRFIRAIERYDSLEHILIVDNCSQDDSYKKLSTLVGGKIELIRTNSNEGYASGNNYGISYMWKKWGMQHILISNPDVEFREKTVLSLEKILNEKPLAATVTCRMNCTSSIKHPIAWKIPTFKDCVMENLILLSKFLSYSSEYRQNELVGDIVKVEVIPGSFFMIDTNKFIDIGGFDEKTFLYYEENILGKKYKDKGCEQYLLMTDEYIHRHSVSINKTFDKVKDRLQMAYNSRLYYCQHYLLINKWQELFLAGTFWIGVRNYILAKKILAWIKRGE